MALGRRRSDEGAVGCGHRRSFRRTVLECKFLSWSLAAAGGLQLLSQRINCLRIEALFVGSSVARCISHVIGEACDAHEALIDHISSLGHDRRIILDLIDEFLNPGLFCFKAVSEALS